MFKKFEDIVKNRHEHIRQLKSSEDKRVMGSLSYVPEELSYAAGMVPVRVFSSEQLPTRADSIMHTAPSPAASCIRASAGFTTFLTISYGVTAATVFSHGGHVPRTGAGMQK